MPKVDIEPRLSVDDLDPSPRAVVEIKGDLNIMVLPDRPVAAFYTEGTDAIRQNLHVYLDGKTHNYIIVEADGQGQVIVGKLPVERFVIPENYSTQVHGPHFTEDAS
jgi:hypothetical protein